MTTERVRHEIKQLLAETEALAERVHQVSEGARYARTPEKLFELYQDLRHARSLVASARDSLGGGASRPGTESEEGGGRGWLRERVAGVSRALLGRGAEAPAEPEPDEPPARVGGFSGDSWSIPVPDLIGFLKMQAKTGELEVELPGEVVRMRFDHGQLVSAFSNATPTGQRLGEILVSMGALTEERLRSFLNCFSTSRVRLGEALLRGELVERDVLQAAVERQVQLLFHRILKAPEARYAFREGPPAEDDESRLDVTFLLLESARLLDEQAA